MKKSFLYSELIRLFLKRNAFVSFTNEGIEVQVYYNGVNDMDLANDIIDYLKNQGINSKIIGRKYKKVQIIC